MIYHITYKAKGDGDCCTVWTKADSKEKAIDDVMREYWDIDEIITVTAER